MVEYNNPQYPYTFTDSYQPDNLVAGITQLVSETQVLLAGQAYQRGQLLGRITSSGKLTLSLAAAADGSQNPYGICVDYYDATGGDVSGGVYVKGEFNQNRVIFGTGQTPANMHDALRDLGIFLKTPVLAA